MMSPFEHSNEPSVSKIWGKGLQLISVATSDALGGMSNEARHVV
jgi:hypothetical protein